MVRNNKKYRERYKKHRLEYYRKRAYGITPEMFLLMMANQNDACAICKRPFAALKGGPCIDHDHSSGVVRGLLCSNCNWGLGDFGDDPRLLARALVYLEDASERQKLTGDEYEKENSDQSHT